MKYQYFLCTDFHTSVYTKFLEYRKVVITVPCSHAQPLLLALQFQVHAAQLLALLALHTQIMALSNDPCGSGNFLTAIFNKSILQLTLPNDINAI